MEIASTDQATNALSAAIANEVAASGSAIEARTAEKAPGLSTGAFAPGGYTYNRVMAPAVPVLQSALVTAAKQALFRQSAKNAINDAQIMYDTARSQMNERQRAAQKKAAEEARRRQAEYDKQLKAMAAAKAAPVTPTAGGKSVVSGVNVKPTGAPVNLSVGKAKSGNVTMGKVQTGNVTMGKVTTGNLTVGKANSSNVKISVKK